MFLRNLVLALCLLLLPGCGILDYFLLPEPEERADELYEGANEAMQDQDYSRAATLYLKLKDNFPFSPYAIEAELSLGDALFLGENYPEAVEAYKDFESLHPRHDAIPYVIFQIGMANMKTFVSVDRPTTALQEALEYFGRLREMYPESEYTLRAVEESINARRYIAEHELYLGDVFYHMEQYGPAWKRYSYIVENFPDVPKVRDLAKRKELEAYYRYREQQSEAARLAIEGSWKKWFNWL